MPMEGLRGTVVPNSPCPPAGRTKSLARVEVGAYGGIVWDGRS